MLASVADCESNQAAWNAAIAVASGGEVWDDGALRWSWQAHDGQVILNFPQSIPVAAARRGVTEARRRGAHIVGAWLAAGVDASPLVRAGFERGWKPWWMAAPLAAIAEPDDVRVMITGHVPEYGDGGRRLLSLVEDPSSRAWHAAAQIDGRLGRPSDGGSIVLTLLLAGPRVRARRNFALGHAKARLPARDVQQHRRL